MGHPNEDYGLNVVNIVGSKGKLHCDIVQINKEGDKEEDIFIDGTHEGGITQINLGKDISFMKGLNGKVPDRIEIMNKML